MKMSPKRKILQKKEGDKKAGDKDEMKTSGGSGMMIAVPHCSFAYETPEAARRRTSSSDSE